MDRNLIGVQFQDAGKIYSFLPGHHDVSVGDSVVVDSDRGTSLARVVRVQFDSADETLEYKEILRKANPKDLEVSTRLVPDEVVSYTRQKVNERELGMKVLKADVVFGGNKVIVYFTAPGRVDFRELVKDLAGGLKTRVELKQVGARDATKVVGGVGVCGRAYCCSTFLREFVPVSIRMAKNQNLALNPMKTAGACGRLLCCLTYEDDTYTHLRKQLPPRGAMVAFEVEGVKTQGKVIKSDLLNQKVVVDCGDAQTHEVKVNDIEVLGKTRSSKVAEPVQEDSDDDWAADLDLAELADFAAQKPKSSPKPQHNEQDDHRVKNRPRSDDKTGQSRSRQQNRPPRHNQGSTQHQNQNRKPHDKKSASGRAGPNQERSKPQKNHRGKKS